MTLKPQEHSSSGSSKRAPTLIALAAAAAVIAAMSPDTVEAGNRGINLDRAPGQAQPEITNLQDANAIASSLATSYTDCHRKKVSLTPAGLTAACNDFKRVTRFGSRFGQGENPTDAWGNTVDWTKMAKWLGLEDWLNNHIANQARIIAQRNTHTEKNRSNTPFQAEKGDNVYVPVPPCMRDVPATSHIVQKQPAQKQKTNPQFQWFVMPRGGTLSQAAQYHRTSVAMLQYWNKISDPNKVEAGQSLWVIPGVK